MHHPANATAKWQLHAIQKKRGSLLVEADFSIAAQERLALVGRSGCGKTTLLRLIAGLEKPDTGMLTCEGVDLWNIPPERRRVGLVSQEPFFFPELSTLENIELGLRFRKGVAANGGGIPNTTGRAGNTSSHVNGVSYAAGSVDPSYSTAAHPSKNVPSQVRETANAAERVRNWTEAMGLNALLKTPIHVLSGGERKRVALARTLVLSPEILLLDEPFNGLDPRAKEDLAQRILEAQRKYPFAILLVSHDRSDLERFGVDRVLVADEREVGKCKFQNVR